jgi:hypothetical protein
MRDVTARRDRRADEVTVVQWGSRRELRDRLVALRTPREIRKKRFATLPATIEERAGSTSLVGSSGLEMKVRRTVGDDKTTFTTLLRGLSPLGDALGCTTYDDSGPRPTERRGWPRGGRTKPGLP